ncbi:hypothetical protein D9758_000889 [Tetrapyrgos nigripes]|uniref:Uncharacterized protein n=1 Tax=Tetrapyrgos nigripes TaxID=182062 RepID=A0A8H5LYE0_9AGAR|nr:hypothetical protein D9758_000889 [Tetrapyrgos nigripes]
MALATRAVALKLNHRVQQLKPAQGDRPRTLTERRAVTKAIMEQTFDPAWVRNNQRRLEEIVDSNLPHSRPLPVIAKQQRAALTFDLEASLCKIPLTTKVAVIHGELDQMIPFAAGMDIARRIPSAIFLPKGDRPGQIPSYAFGHQWFEYFGTSIWINVIESFMMS